MSEDLSWMKKGLKKKSEAMVYRAYTKIQGYSKYFGQEWLETPIDNAPKLLRLPYGNLSEEEQGTAIPPAPEPDITIRDPAETYDGENEQQIIMTVLPIGMEWSDPDGDTECLLFAIAKRQILGIPGFPQKLRQPPNKRYEIRPATGRGKCREQAGRHEFRKLLKVLVDRMKPVRRAQFMDLVNSHEHDGSGPLLGRLRTNGFSVTFDGEDSNEYVINGRTRQYTAIGNDISRVNHSCCANACYSFHHPSFGMELRAVRRIVQGEEVTVSYLPFDFAPAVQRQRSLEPYDFICTCPACTNSDHSDAVRAIFGELTVTKIHSLPLNTTLKYLQSFEQEGIERYQEYLYLLSHAMAIYKISRDTENLKKYAKKFYMNGLGKWGREDVNQFIPDRPECTIWHDFIWGYV
ncbi:hypothetical protein C8Q75DRAFT_891206 [Abortiporus biennis]|nr:hypothetical protein C8Q75DRAFT_891206 [Abortiporus biennis]